MKEIKLKIDDKAYKRIEGEISIRKMCGGYYGILDEFIMMIVKTIRAGKKEAIIELKEKKSKKRG